MSAVRETLVAARELIADESRWIKGAFTGMSATRNDGAASYCADGALMEGAGLVGGRDLPVSELMAFPLYGEAFNILRDTIGVRSVITWNDAPERTHAEVLAAFDAAIEATP